MVNNSISTGMQFAEKPHDASKIRKRSYMTDEDAYRVLGEFAQTVLRMCNSSEAYNPTFKNPNAENGVLIYKFETAGDFVNTPDVFEALRVAGRYKLPKINK